MKIIFDDKAKKFIKEKNIKDIVIQIDKDSKNACCGLGSIDFEIYTNSKDKVKNFKKFKNEYLDIYYEPNIEFYFEDDDEMIIKLIRFLAYKKLYVANEVNVLK